MTPAHLLSYYPNYELLDNIISKGNFKKLNLFLDLKNMLQTVYMEHAIKILVENSLKANYIDTSVFSSVLPFLVFHKLYAIKRQLDVNFYFFFETGRSYYHKNLNKKYKISRQIDELYGLDKDKREKFSEVMQSNFILIEKALNFMPKVKVFRLQNLEADFIPYYLITRKSIGSKEDECNLIYSNDHDLHQCCNYNTFIFSKAGKNRVKKIILENEVMGKFVGKENEIPCEYLPLAMSIVGDTGDDVGGIKGIGPKTFYSNFEKINSMIGNNMNILYDNVMKGSFIFDKKGVEFENKYINQIVDSEEENQLISRNLKQVSFELISRHVENPDSTEMLKRRDSIDETLNLDRIAPIEKIRKALELNRVSIENDDLEVIYYKA